MAREQIHPPSAACLATSMRDLGYSLETAVADLVDNSISAGADEIAIFCESSATKPLLAIIDNGKGMTCDELLDAMRHGTKNPSLVRSPQDLGRFGLGLKTASFSQCRSLTVVAFKDGARCGAEWDLDRIDDEDDWILSILDPEDIAPLPYVDLIGSHGTMVIWRKLDRLVEDQLGDSRDEIVNEKLDALGKHLSLVFHRFLAGEVKGFPRVSIAVNGHKLQAFDPFCKRNQATQILPEEVVRLGTAEVRFQPYILPHHSRLTAREYDFYQGRSDFMSNQGAYIYRSGRLVAWGDWFRLVPKGEATKLARVQIDFPNSLDEAWTIDIKKSRAHPPRVVRERLRLIISRIVARSVTVHRGRGQKLFQGSGAGLWERYADHGGIRFAINREHPLILSLAAKLQTEDAGLLQVFLESVAASLPLEMIYSDYSTHPREVNQVAIDEEQILERLRSLKRVLFGSGDVDPKVFLEIVRSTHLFDSHIEIAKTFICEVSA